MTDRSGDSATDEVAVTIRDSVPPDLAVVLAPAFLWPPDRRLVDIRAGIDARDDCGPASFALESVVSTDPGDGDIQGASFGTGDTSFGLRATRAGSGPGRVYTVTYLAMDLSGNATLVSKQVIVAHDLND